MARLIDEGTALRLEGTSSEERRREWRPWKGRGYRVLAPDGVTVWHERCAIRRLVLEAFGDLDVDVFLFGSRASGEARERSDYDVGFVAAPAVSRRRLEELRERLEELPIPSHVDLVDFARVPERFSALVLESGKDVEVWKRRRAHSIFTSKS